MQKISVTCDRSVVFSWYSGFCHDIVESGVRHHEHEPHCTQTIFENLRCLLNTLPHDL
jgi:hypothetical protein